MMPEKPYRDEARIADVRQACSALSAHLAPASEPEVMVYLGMMLQHLAIREGSEGMYAALFRDYLRLLQFPAWAWAEVYDRVLLTCTYFPRINELAAMFEEVVGPARRAHKRLVHLVRACGEIEPPALPAPKPRRPTIGDLQMVDKALRSIGINPRPWPEWAEEELVKEFSGRKRA